jgi:hypothetical protein
MNLLYIPFPEISEGPLLKEKERSKLERYWSYKALWAGRSF